MFSKADFHGAIKRREPKNKKGHKPGYEFDVVFLRGDEAVLKDIQTGTTQRLTHALAAEAAHLLSGRVHVIGSPRSN